MSKPEFDFSKYVKVPEEWLEKALDVPNTVQKAPKAMPPLHRYLTAASIVLVAAIGVTSYFFFRNNTPITVAPLTPSETAVSQTETTLPATEYPTVPGTDAATHSPTTTPSQPPTQRASDAANTPTTSPSPASSGHPTETPAPAPTTAPTAQPPTASPTVRPTTPPAPTEQMPTEPKPTEQEPDAPTEIATEEEPPIELPTLNEWNLPIELVGHLPDEIRLNEEYVYCRIERENGELVGDKDLYSREHAIRVYREYSAVVYLPNSDYRGIELSPGDYVYYFYDRTGKTFDSGTFHVD